MRDEHYEIAHSPPPTPVSVRKEAMTMAARLHWERRGATVCRVCKAPVLFAKNRKSERWQILDALPDWNKGNIVLVGLEAETLECVISTDVVVTSVNRNDGVPYFTDHHATCDERSKL